MTEKIECMICHKSFKMLSTHLKGHGITPTDYKEMYPDAEMVSASVRSKMSASNTIAQNRPELKEANAKRMAKRNKENWKDPSYRKKMRKMRSDANKRNWKKKGYKEARTKEAKARFTSAEFLDSVRSTRRKTGKKVLTERWKTNKDEMLAMSSKALSDWWKANYEEGCRRSKELWDDPSFREKISKAVSKANVRRWKDPDFRQLIISAVKKKWEDELFRNKVSSTMRKKWKDTQFRRRMSELASKTMLRLWKEETERMLEATKHNAYGVATKYTSSKTGTYTYRSKLEASFAKHLDDDDTVLFFDYESQSIPYLFEGKEHTYTPDFHVVFIDGTEIVIELKPNKYAPDEQTLAKWREAEKVLDGFEIMEFPVSD